MAYLTLAQFKLRSLMPASDLDVIETVAPGFIDQQLESVSQWLDTRLRKRYAAPFAAPYPEAVLAWVARIVTVRCYLRRGVDPTDAQFSEIKADADAATAEVKEAADSNEGLFDLPLRGDVDASAIVRGGPYVYSEASPYVAFDLQRDTAQAEDQSRGGSFG